jgi:hypothetical protein
MANIIDAEGSWQREGGGVTSYFKFLEWWLLPCTAVEMHDPPMGRGTVALENALVSNLEKQIPRRRYQDRWQYHYQWGG